MKTLHPPRLLLLVALLALIAGAVSGCSSGQDNTHGLEMAPLDSMPANVQAAPVSVQQAYQFAVANPEMVQELPCYCGCGPMGHASNYACYVSDQNADGTPVFDSHALGCSICVDITQDAMRLTKEGKTLPEIRLYVDDTYSRYGPSNMP